MKNRKKMYLKPIWAGILLLMTSLCFQNKLLAQSISVNFKNVPLIEVLKETEKQTSFSFVYNNSLIDVQKRVSISVNKSEITPFMSKLLAGTDIGFKIINKQITLFPAGFQNDNQASQERTLVKGMIIDEDNLPLPGVYVYNKSTKKGTASGVSGEFSIEASKNDLLTFSLIGMVTLDETVIDVSNKINIRMKSDILVLQDVVVTGYQTLSKERATGSFSYVDNKRLGITNLASTDFAKGLAGMTAGVLVDKSGNLQIRGVSSIKSDTRPLIIVDGFPIESGNYTINPNDVESVTVLKDAAAASIWGVRASNGVVVVKTISGGSTDGKAKFNFTTNLSFDRKPDLSYYHRASSADFVDFEAETVQKGWFKPQNADATAYSRVGELYYKKYKGLINDSQVLEGLNQLKGVDNLSQQDLFYRGAAKQQYNLSIQGGNNFNTYYVSTVYTRSLASEIGNKSDAIILNVKNSMQLLPRLTLNIGINSTFNNSEIAKGFSFQTARPYNLFVDEQGNYLSMYNSVVPEHLKASYYSNGYLNWDSNPKEELDNSNNTSRKFEVRYNVGLDFKIAEGVIFSSKYLNELGYSNSDNLQNLNSYYPRYLANVWRVYDNTSKSYVNKFPVGPILDKQKDQFNGWTFRNTLSFNKNLGKDHGLNAIVGTEIRKITNKGNAERYYNYNEKALTSDIFDLLSLSNYTPDYIGNYNRYTWTPGFYERDRRFFSLFANAAYTYKGLYTLSGSLRVDQSNLFGTDPKYRYQPIWSIGGNWRVSGEKFMENVTFVNRLIARFTYGINGNIGNSSPYPIASTGKNFNTQENMLTFSNPENQQLRPEKTAVTNIGIDFAILNNRISGSLDYYYKKSYDLLGNSILDPTSGFTRAEVNTARMVNKGVDLSLDANILNGEVGLDMIFNIGYNKNEVTEVLMPSNTASTYITGTSPIKGKPLSYMFSYRWAGLSSKGDPQVYNAKDEIIGWSGSEMTDASALHYAGTLTPPVYGGLMFNLRYRGFTLSPQFTWKMGHVLRLPVTRMDLYGNTTEMIAQRWQKAGDELNTNIPRVYSSSSLSTKWNNYYRNNDIWEGSASYIRLSSLTLSYDMPAKYLKNTFSGVKITAQGNNLWLWANNDYEIDPEYYDMRGGYYSFPPVKNFVISLNLIF